MLLNKIIDKINNNILRPRLNYEVNQHYPSGPGWALAGPVNYIIINSTRHINKLFIA